MSDAEKAKQGISSLPENLNEALKAFERDKFLQKVLGAHVSEKYVEAKKKEWNDYSTYISQWEIDHDLYRL